jgi:hypothetical protein
MNKRVEIKRLVDIPLLCGRTVMEDGRRKLLCWIVKRRGQSGANAGRQCGRYVQDIRRIQDSTPW